MTVKLFITGTDTNIGKTYISISLLRMYNSHGLSTLGVKPIASGCKTINGKLYSDDALKLLDASSVKLTYDSINPFALEPAIAPHIASNNGINIQLLNEKCAAAFTYPADVCIIEGAGGWCTPINLSETMADFVVSHSFKVILVVGMRVGCINHTILTARAMQEDGAKVMGWIANCVEPGMAHLEDNIGYLRQHLTIPYLGMAVHHGSVDYLTTLASPDENARTFPSDICSIK